MTPPQDPTQTNRRGTQYRAMSNLYDASFLTYTSCMQFAVSQNCVVMGWQDGSSSGSTAQCTRLRRQTSGASH